MVKKFSNGIWDQLEDNLVDATDMRMRSDLLSAVKREIRQLNLSQREAAKKAGIGLHKVNDILTGKIDKTTVKILIKAAVNLGLPVSLTVGPRQEPPPAPIS